MNQNSYDIALNLYKNKNYNDAFNLLLEISANDLKANTLLGICYLNGDGCEVSFEKAFEALSKSALAQESSAYYYLGYLYEMGYGTKQNDIQAMLWYKNSAKLNNLESMVALGRIELKYDEDDAIKWLDEASKNNSIEAMLLLADHYHDNDKALYLKYLEMAGKLKNPKALFFLGIYYIEVSPNKSLAEKYLNEAVALGYDPAFIVLGKAYLDGMMVNKNLKRGFECLNLAQMKGIHRADIPVAKCYFEGIGIKADPLKAKEILESAAFNSNSKEAMLLLGDYSNTRIPNGFYDPYLALYWWEKAANLGSKEAMVKVAKCYQNKEGTNRQSFDLAYKYYKMAEDLGDSEASEALKHYHKNLLGHYRYKK